jgi:PucR C-terminal helix-turn-helix domain
VATTPMPGPTPSTVLTEAEIVRFFDDHLVAGTTVDRLLEDAAGYAACRVGRSTPVGRSGRAAAHAPAGAHRAPVRTGGEVWVVGLDDPIATCFLDRLAVAVALLDRFQLLPTEPVEPLVALLDAATGEAARATALERLGLARTAPVRVVVSKGPENAVQRLVAALTARERVVAQARLNGMTVVLVAVRDEGELVLRDIPAGVRAAYGTACEAALTLRSYTNALDAYRFTRPSPRDRGPYPWTCGVWINGARLSGLAALSRLPREEIESIPEVEALARLAEQHGERILEILEAYATTESLRKAADNLYVHHNTVLYWVQKASQEFGYSLTEPYRRAQLFISLCLLRLLRDPDSE